MNRPPPKSAPWPAVLRVAPARLRPAGHGIQRLYAFARFQIRIASSARIGCIHAILHENNRSAFMIAKPRTSSLKLIIGILQRNLKTPAFCAQFVANGGRELLPKLPSRCPRIESFAD